MQHCTGTTSMGNGHVLPGNLRGRVLLLQDSKIPQFGIAERVAFVPRRYAVSHFRGAQQVTFRRSRQLNFRTVHS
jgi:hypothetical protein